MCDFHYLLVCTICTSNNLALTVYIRTLALLSVLPRYSGARQEPAHRTECISKEAACKKLHMQAAIGMLSVTHVLLLCRLILQQYLQCQRPKRSLIYIRDSDWL
jgi:hypothetical protein